MFSKAEMLVEKGCIKREGNAWICLPVPNYNHSTYLITPLKEPFRVGGFDVFYECSCQGYNVKKGKGERPYCSHIMAVEIKRQKENAMRFSIESGLRE